MRAPIDGDSRICQPYGRTTSQTPWQHAIHFDQPSQPGWQKTNLAQRIPKNRRKAAPAGAERRKTPRMRNQRIAPRKGLVDIRFVCETSYLFQVHYSDLAGCRSQRCVFNLLVLTFLRRGYLGGGEPICHLILMPRPHTLTPRSLVRRPGTLRRVLWPAGFPARDAYAAGLLPLSCLARWRCPRYSARA